MERSDIASDPEHGSAGRRGVDDSHLQITPYGTNQFQYLGETSETFSLWRSFICTFIFAVPIVEGWFNAFNVNPNGSQMLRTIIQPDIKTVLHHQWIEATKGYQEHEDHVGSYGVIADKHSRKMVDFILHPSFERTLIEMRVYSRRYLEPKGLSFYDVQQLIDSIKVIIKHSNKVKLQTEKYADYAEKLVWYIQNNGLSIDHHLVSSYLRDFKDIISEEDLTKSTLLSSIQSIHYSESLQRTELELCTKYTKRVTANHHSNCEAFITGEEWVELNINRSGITYVCGKNFTPMRCVKDVQLSLSGDFKIIYAAEQPYQIDDEPLSTHDAIIEIQEDERDESHTRCHNAPSCITTTKPIALRSGCKICISMTTNLCQYGGEYNVDVVNRVPAIDEWFGALACFEQMVERNGNGYMRSDDLRRLKNEVAHLKTYLRIHEEARSKYLG